MEYYNKMLCVSYDELTTGDDPVMNIETLRKNITRGKIVRARRGGGEGNPALVVYSSLPARYRAKYEAKNGNPEAMVKEECKCSPLTLDSAARKFYEQYEYDLNGQIRHLSVELIESYTLNASVLNLLQATQNDRVALSKALNNSRSDLWEVLHDESEKLREEYGHTLPQNTARLRAKLNEYQRDGYVALINGRIGNRNTLKIVPEMKRKILAMKRSRVKVLTDRQIYDEINRIAPANGWKPLKSERSLVQWLNSPSIQPLWYDAVHGEQASHQRFDRKHRTVLPELRDSLWYGDGTKLNLYYRDAAGKMRTINVYEVMDAATEVLLGYYIGESEDYIAQYHAFRMAVQVSGHKPFEIVYDNQGGHKKMESQGFFSKICQRHRVTAPYNGASKTIENLFYRFQSQVLHQRWNFTGQNVTTKKDISRPNIEFIEANVHQLPTLEELKQQYAEARREWNAMPHPATGRPRIEMYNSSVNPSTQAVTEYDMIDMFWLISDKPCTFTTRGIELTVKKQKYAYEVFSSPGIPDFEWRRLHTYEQFYVQYDPYEMTSVRLLAMDANGKLRFERIAEPPLVIHRAQQEQTAEERQLIATIRDAVHQERVERIAQGMEIEYEEGVAAEQNGLRSASPKGLSKAGKRQLEKRLAKYRKPAEEYQLGRRTKTISMFTFDEMYDRKDEPEDMTIDIRKTASKL